MPDIASIVVARVCCVRGPFGTVLLPACASRTSRLSGLIRQTILISDDRRHGPAGLALDDSGNAADAPARCRPSRAGRSAPSLNDFAR